MAFGMEIPADSIHVYTYKYNEYWVMIIPVSSTLISGL